MALEQMEGFELAGRQLRVNTVHEKGSNIKIVGGGPVDSLDENGGTSYPYLHLLSHSLANLLLFCQARSIITLRAIC